MCFLFTTPGLTVHICIDRQVTEESGQQVFRLHLLTCFTLNQSNSFISTYQPNNLWDIFSLEELSGIDFKSHFKRGLSPQTLCNT